MEGAIRYLSNTAQMAILRPYQQIIGMGMAAVPLILEELRREPGPMVLGAGVHYRGESGGARRCRSGAGYGRRLDPLGPAARSDPAMISPSLFPRLTAVNHRATSPRQCPVQLRRLGGGRYWALVAARRVLAGRNPARRLRDRRPRVGISSRSGTWTARATMASNRELKKWPSMAVPLSIPTPPGRRLRASGPANSGKKRTLSIPARMTLQAASMARLCRFSNVPSAVRRNPVGRCVMRPDWARRWDCASLVPPCALCRPPQQGQGWAATARTRRSASNRSSC